MVLKYNPYVWYSNVYMADKNSYDKILFGLNARLQCGVAVSPNKCGAVQCCAVLHFADIILRAETVHS